MDRNKITASNLSLHSPVQDELCNILVETHQSYWEDVITEGMTYEDFVTNFFGERHGLSGNNAYSSVYIMFDQHQPIIEHQFKSSAFAMDDAMTMLQEFEHVNSFFDRSMIDIQLKSVIPKLEKRGLMQLLVECVNTTAMFHLPMNVDSMKCVLTGTSKKDYGIYNVSHFAYFMKELEKQRLLVPFWQAMVSRLSRIVYHGHYITQTALSTSVNRLGLQMRRPWIYDSIDDWMKNIHQLIT